MTQPEVLTRNSILGKLKTRLDIFLNLFLSLLCICVNHLIYYALNNVNLFYRSNNNFYSDFKARRCESKTLLTSDYDDFSLFSSSFFCKIATILTKGRGNGALTDIGKRGFCLQFHFNKIHIYSYYDSRILSSFFYFSLFLGILKFRFTKLSLTSPISS